MKGCVHNARGKFSKERLKKMSDDNRLEKNPRWKGGIWSNDKKKYNREYTRKLRKNPKYRLDCSLSALIYQKLKKNKGGRKWENLVGYTLKDLTIHLENLFDENTNWENYGSYWELDHIKPKNTFTYIDAEDKEFKECWALSNLRPLEKILNRSRPKDGRDILTNQITNK